MPHAQPRSKQISSQTPCLLLLVSLLASQYAAVYINEKFSKDLSMTQLKGQFNLTRGSWKIFEDHPDRIEFHPDQSGFMVFSSTGDSKAIFFKSPRRVLVFRLNDPFFLNPYTDFSLQREGFEPTSVFESTLSSRDYKPGALDRSFEDLEPEVFDIRHFEYRLSKMGGFPYYDHDKFYDNNPDLLANLPSKIAINRDVKKGWAEVKVVETLKNLELPMATRLIANMILAMFMQDGQYLCPQLFEAFNYVHFTDPTQSRPATEKWVKTNLLVPSAIAAASEILHSDPERKKRILHKVDQIAKKMAGPAKRIVLSYMTHQEGYYLQEFFMKTTYDPNHDITKMRHNNNDILYYLINNTHNIPDNDKFTRDWMFKYILGMMKVNDPENNNEVFLARQEVAKNDEFKGLFQGIFDEIKDHFPGVFEQLEGQSGIDHIEKNQAAFESTGDWEMVQQIIHDDVANLPTSSKTDQSFATLLKKVSSEDLLDSLLWSHYLLPTMNEFERPIWQNIAKLDCLKQNRLTDLTKPKEMQHFRMYMAMVGFAQIDYELDYLNLH